EGVPKEILEIREINIGTWVFEAGSLLEALDEVPTEENGERYLTNVLPILTKKGRTVAAHKTHDTLSAMGVNNRADLMEVTPHAQRRILAAHARAGVTFTAPDSVAIDKQVEIGADTTIATAVTLRGTTRIGAGCEIGPATTITDSQIGQRVAIP